MREADDQIMYWRADILRRSGHDRALAHSFLQIASDLWMRYEDASTETEEKGQGRREREKEKGEYREKGSKKECQREKDRWYVVCLSCFGFFFFLFFGTISFFRLF